jgi:hypothetical protein
MKALIEESKGFNFRLQGYGKISSARKGLQKININRLIGFIYLSDNVSDEIALREFIILLDKMCVRKTKRFVFALKEGNNLESLLKDIEIKNLEIYYQEYDDLTDVVIKRYLFGTVLSLDSTLYKHNRKNEIHNFYSLPSIKFDPIYSSLQLKVLDPVRERETLEEAEKDDLYIPLVKSLSPIYTLLRRYVIRLHYKSDTSVILKLLEEEINKIPSNKSRYSIYILLKMIGESYGQSVEIQIRFEDF